MRPVHFRSLPLAALAVLTLTASVAAQERPSGLLNNLEVRQLVARAEPADHARLGEHFTALGDRYAAQAKRHLAMSQSFVGNPSRNLGTGMSAHCKRLATLSTQSATTARELATYHEKRATGRAATPPPDQSRLQEGAGAPDPTETELSALAAKASTPADHRTLEEHFRNLAKQYTTEAGNHAAMAQAYRGTRIAEAAGHHDRLARLSRDAAREATEAADMHKGMANPAR